MAMGKQQGSGGVMKLTREFLNGEYCLSFPPEERDTVITLLARAINTWPDVPADVVTVYDTLRGEK